jgi:glycosyltransferase involved in cell wall biosynthesis
MFLGDHLAAHRAAFLDETVFQLTPLRVTYIHQDGSITGSAISLINLLSGFSNEQVLPTILIAKEGPVREKFEQAGAHVMHHPFTTYWTFPGPRWYWRSNLTMQRALLPDQRLAEKIADSNPDIVHINDKASLSAGISLKGKLPIVQHLRSNYFKTYSWLNKQLSRRAIAKYADLLIAISEDETDGFEGNENLHVIYNSIHPEIAAAARQNVESIRKEFDITDEIVICYVGLLNENKGAWIFLQTCGLLKKKFPGRRFRFFVVAPLPDESAFLVDDKGRKVHPMEYAKAQCKEFQIDRETIFTGYRTDVLNILAASTLLLVMNKQGVLGRQPLEAMSVGTPVVAVVGHSGKSSIIENGINGMIVKDYHPESIAIAASEIITNNNLREEMSANSLHTALQKFNPIMNSQKVFDLYRLLVKKKVCP